jgi:hypothetical protein
MIDSLPYLAAHNDGCVALIGDIAMGINRDHRRFAEECVAMAHASEDANDKALWITLAQSWVRLAEHAAHVSAGSEAAAVVGNNALAVQSAD